MSDKHVRYNSIELVKRMSAMSDYLWQKLVESKEFCQQVLQVILSMPDLIVEESTPQKSLRNVEGRSVVLDVLCKDSTGKYFNIEVQKENDDDHQKRVRCLMCFKKEKLYIMLTEF